jgi:DNA-binding CsgD family transcriptional regulator
VTPLTDRHRERGLLDRLVDAVRAGESKVLVLRGDPGVGKTVLLDYLTRRARGCHLLRAAGVQSEMELAFAGLHQLCAPLLVRMDQLPVPQRDALRIAFGLSAGPPPDRFLVSLAVLSLLSEVAEERPLVCVVDDHQWLDRASAQALGFVARRLAAEPVAMVFAAREPGEELAGLPELDVAGLREADARALLDSVLTGPLDAVPPPTRMLLALAAADPSGDPALVWRAAGRLGIGLQAATAAEEAGLADFGARVRFRHPLLRSVAYQSASPADRQAIHVALAEVTDPAVDPDRRAWHRAQAAAGPDEEVAAELEHSAGRAQARGGLAAAAAFAERSALLSTDPARRAERTLTAAHLNLEAGAFGAAAELLATAANQVSGPLDELKSARLDLLRGQLVFASGLGSEAPPLLLKAASRLEPLNLGLARETYLSAWMAALFAGRLAGSGDLLEVSRAARVLPPADPPDAASLVLDGLTLLVTDGLAAAAPTLRQAVGTFSGTDITADEAIRWGWFAQAAASALWDDEVWRAMLLRQVQLARDVGALDQLPIMLAALGTVVVWGGDFAAAAALIAESDAVCEATGTRAAPFTAILLASWRGREAEAAPLIEVTIAEATAGGQGIAVTYSRWAAAVLGNGLGRYPEALTAARQASEDMPGLYMSMWALPELIEAAVRSGNTQLAADALIRLAGITQAGQAEFGLGIEARSRALLSEGETAERLYREAIDRLGRTALRPELARAHLLYGEWLRQEDRRAEAREQLRIAHDMLTAIGAEAFAERARTELAAAGETVRRHTVETRASLTAQEASIARLAGAGRTNPEIGAQLFLSARTVEWHLRKVFGKLGISSRRDLGRALESLGPEG